MDLKDSTDLQCYILNIALILWMYWCMWVWWCNNDNNNISLGTVHMNSKIKVIFFLFYMSSCWLGSETGVWKMPFLVIFIKKSY